MATVPSLLSVATAVPRYPLDQKEVVERIKLLFGRSPDLPRLLPVFLNTGIDRRYSCVPIEWYDRAHGWAERNRIYLASALDLLEAATHRVLSLSRRQGGHRRYCCRFDDGYATPSLDALLIERMGLCRTVQRLPIFGLGCAGGVLGLARAASQVPSSLAKWCFSLSWNYARYPSGATIGGKAISLRRPWFLEPVKPRGVIRMEEFCMLIGVKFTTRPGDGQFMVRREAYQRLLEVFTANGISFSHRHVKVEMIGDKPEETLLPSLAGGGAELPIEPPLALASSE